jgi:hypothetical protein
VRWQPENGRQELRLQIAEARDFFQCESGKEMGAHSQLAGEARPPHRGSKKGAGRSLAPT